METVKLISWEDRNDLPGGRFVLRLPYSNLADIVDSVGELDARPTALLPPYERGKPSFTARCAAVARDKFPEYRIMVAVGGARKDAEKFLRTLRSAGFDAFAFPPLISSNETHKLAGFWDAAHLLRQTDWYHVCGIPWYHACGMPLRDVQEDVRWAGEWTWGEEEL